MSENPENQDDKIENDEVEPTQEDSDDLKEYLSDMNALESDFSDLDDLDLEEIREMQEAIAMVKETEALPTENTKGAEEITEVFTLDERKALSDEQEYLEEKEAMISDFSDIDEIDFDELKEMQEAINTVRKEEITGSLDEGEQSEQSTMISSDLEDRIKQELLERKAEKEKEVVTPEKFLEYITNKRDKIWYHALYYLVFQTEDNIASKQLLFEMLKEDTSKSPIDPIPEHQFYFGLGYILRLTLNEKQVVRYMSGSKFKINISIDGLIELLTKAGEPISTRPILREDEKKKMYQDFLKDDFLDI